MAEMDYEKRKSMTAADKLKEGLMDAAKGFFRTESKAKAEPAKKFEDGGKDTRNAIEKRKAATDDVMKAYKKGGLVKKTGPAKLHQGERVLTVKQTKSPVIKKALKKIGKK